MDLHKLADVAYVALAIVYVIAVVLTVVVTVAWALT